MSTQNVCFHREIRKIFVRYSCLELWLEYMVVSSMPQICIHCTCTYKRAVRKSSDLLICTLLRNLIRIFQFINTLAVFYDSVC